MPKVEIKKNQVWVGKKGIPLISGEVHYWRLNPNYWNSVLDRVREMGLRVISTYVPWDFHEFRRGHFDFHGRTDPARDLNGFLALTRKEGFWVIIRPGPYIYSEWPNEGVPSYAYRYHRLDPRFMNFAKSYMAQVIRVLKPYMATRTGGHIILLQSDNEIDPWPDVFGHQYGLIGQAGLFQTFLEELYHGRINVLNEAWGTEYKSFREAGPFMATMFKEETGLPLKGDKELKRNLDYLKFKHEYCRRYAEWSVKTYRELGVDVPIYLNLYPFFYAHDWVKMQSVSDMVGVDLYPANEFSEDEFEQRKFTDKVRYLKSVSKIPFVAEFAAGVWHARHYETGVLTPNHYRLITFSALIGGAAGWNWYMLVNRDNWYMSPINEWGRIRHELYDVFKQIVKVYSEIDPPRMTKITQVGVTFHPLQLASKSLTHDNSMLLALYQADTDYETWDARHGTTNKKVVFYAGNQWLEKRGHENLRAYVESGGTLVAFRNYPRKDENFRHCSIVGFEEPKSVLFEFKRKFAIRLHETRPFVTLNSSVYCFQPASEGNLEELIRADFGPFGKAMIGYVKKIGRGRILHLGVEPSEELIREILDFLNLELGAYSTTRDVKTALFSRGSDYYLIVVNNGSEDKSASIYLPALDCFRHPLRVSDLMSGKQESYSLERRHPFSLEIPRKDGRVLKFHPTR